MKKTSKLTIVLMILFGAVFLFASVKLFGIMRDTHQDNRAFEELAERVQISGMGVENRDENIGGEKDGTKDEAVGEEASGAGENEKKIDSEALLAAYQSLKEENPDFFAWISIEGTKVNYPVMYTPEEEEYYIYRNFEGEDSSSGVPFLAAACFSGCGNYMVHGHNMKSGSMFASLLSYADEDYFKEHPKIRFDTPERLGVYDVIAAFYIQAEPVGTPGAFPYYAYTDLTDPQVFAEYLDQVGVRRLYDTGSWAEYGDELLTLSTCSYHTDNGRFVVVARKKAKATPQ